MDTTGAAALRVRLEQQQHWLQATAIGEGRLPASDPDVAALQEIGVDERFYEDGDGRFAKRLVDGAWERFELGGAPGSTAV